MNQVEIAIKKLRALVQTKDNSNYVLITNTAFQLQAEAMSLGFMFEESALIYFSNNIDLYPNVFKTLQVLVGADKVWKPFYRNFPQEVIDMDEAELYMNAVRHYWSSGQWRPDYESKVKTDSKLPIFEDATYKPIKLITSDEFLKLFSNLLGSNGSLTEYDKLIITWFLANYNENLLAKNIPNITFKETLCQFVADCHTQNLDSLALHCIKTTTDVLRVACHLSGGDVSLATNTKFRLTNKERKFIVSLLENVISEEDVARYQGRWVRLFHCLHIGTFKNAIKCNKIAKIARNGRCRSFNSEVELALGLKDTPTAVLLLSKRPGDFARRLDHLLRLSNNPSLVLEDFATVVDKVDTRVLYQLLNHFKYRFGLTDRIVLPKGSIAKAKILREELPEINQEIISKLQAVISQAIFNKFKLLPKLGKVYIDPILAKCPIQMSMRNAADGLKVLQRGTRLPLGNKNILRFFIHWIGQDIDLSACFLTKDLKYHSTISYYNLKEKDNYQAVHSGDITYAPGPDGACEFIDIDLTSITDPAIKYIAMDVRVFSGAPFSLQSANAGWMLRTEMGRHGDVFDAKTVEQRIALSTDSKQCMVALFDVKLREVIWVDLAGQSNGLQGNQRNNVASNKPSIIEMLTAIVRLRQPTLNDLFTHHTFARYGEYVTSKEEAEVIFDEKYIFEYEKVLSEYLK